MTWQKKWEALKAATHGRLKKMGKKEHKKINETKENIIRSKLAKQKQNK
jgi:hypothetical protein